MINSVGLNNSLLLGAQSLNNQQVAIETIGNNISNINTPGYARQQAVFSPNVQEGQSGEVDFGASISTIESLRSPLLDSLVQQSLGNQGYADNNASLASSVQDALGEQFTANSSSSTSGTAVAGSGPIQDAMSNFFSSLESLAATPTDQTAREAVVSDAQALSTAINSAYQRMQQTQSGVATDATNAVTQINQLTQSIAHLNQQILQATAAGSDANELSDSRTADIEQLSSLVNITATTQTDGTVSVALADNSSVVLVDHDDSNGTGITQSLSASYNAAGDPPLTVSGSTTGNLGVGVPSGGSLGADLNIANNVIGVPAADGNVGILGSLDTVANQLMSLVNSQNEAGYDLNGNAGGAIFTGTGASGISVNTNVINDPSLIAASSSSTGSLDGSNAQAMANLQSNANILPAFQNMVAGVGQTVSQAQASQTTQDQITQQLQTQRDSVSGVSIDEEMTNLINFQNSYAASAHFISTISTMYDSLLGIQTS